MTDVAIALALYFTFVILPGAVGSWQSVRRLDVRHEPAERAVNATLWTIFAWPVLVLYFAVEDWRR